MRIALLDISYSMLIRARLGWILAIGWQGSVVGLSFAAGTIVRVPVVNCIIVLGALKTIERHRCCSGGLHIFSPEKQR